MPISSRYEVLAQEGNADQILRIEEGRYSGRRGPGGGRTYRDSGSNLGRNIRAKPGANLNVIYLDGILGSHFRFPKRFVKSCRK
jgi:hypothetical protein